MTLIKKIKDKKVNFEFNKEYINVVTDKIVNNDEITPKLTLNNIESPWCCPTLNYWNIFNQLIHNFAP